MGLGAARHARRYQPRTINHAGNGRATIDEARRRGARADWGIELTSLWLDDHAHDYLCP